MVHLKYPSFPVLQNLNLPLPTSQTYVVQMIQLGYEFIFLTHIFSCPTLYKNKKEIQYTSYEAMLEPPVLLACMASVVRHNKKSILPLLYNIASENYP